MNFGGGYMTVKSARRVLDIFEMIAKHPNGLTIKEISSLLTIPQSSTHNLLETLLNAGYLYRDEGKKYHLGAKLIHIGSSAMESLDIYDIGTRYLRTLVNNVDETVFMAVLSDNELVYIAKIDSNRSIRTSAQPGKRKPLYCTGLGKSFLAFISEEEKDELLQRIRFKKFTENTITDRLTLEKQLEEYRNLGYSIDDEESEEGLYCLAAPIFGAGGGVIAAISVAGPKERMFSRKEEIIRELKKTSYKISHEMGYRLNNK